MAKRMRFAWDAHLMLRSQLVVLSAVCKVTQVLALAPVGEVIFRPSSKGCAHLTATVKLTDSGPLLHIDIAEDQKPSTAEVT